MNYKPSFLQQLARLVYSLLWIIGIPIAIFLTSVKKQKVVSSHKARWRERFGFVTKHDLGCQTILMHCVSVGEVNVASRMIKEIRDTNPNVHFTITTTTATGSARVRALHGNTVEHFYLPYDLPICMGQMLKRVSPSVLIIVEVELWPNLVAQAWKKGIPTILLNARMTDRSAKRYAKLSLLLSPILNQITHVCAQGQRDHDNYLALGLNKDKLTLTNNLKFDMALTNVSRQPLPKNSDILTLVGASTHEGEEEALLGCALQVRKAGMPLRLILVPRHPERFDVVATWLKKQSQPFSQTTITKHLMSDEMIILVDEMGRLDEVYSVSDFAFVGGSLVEKGGHNALEPAAYSLPIIMGPHIFNNPEICNTLEANQALEIVHSSEELFQVVFELCTHRDKSVQKGRSAKRVLEQNIGALKQSLKIVQPYLN